MNIALLNMMPDAALKATDRQFLRLLSGHDDVSLFRYTYPEISRSKKALEYVEQAYQSEDEIRVMNPDAVIITGANVSDPRLEIQSFWKPLQETMAWTNDTGCPVLCSCLSSHAVMQFWYGERRLALPQKIWGVFEHEVVAGDHVLATGLPAVVPVPQSRFNEITVTQFQAAGFDVIIADSTAGVHLAANKDNSLVLMQGHPEYDDVSLLKEYKREVGLFVDGLRDDYPPMPEFILEPEGLGILETHQQSIEKASVGGGASKKTMKFPELEVKPFLTHQWNDSAKQVFDNWLIALRCHSI